MLILLKSRLKVKLAEVEMQQQELANILNVTKQTMNAWCNNRANPPLEVSFKIAKILNCKVDDLFQYIDED